MEVPTKLLIEFLDKKGFARRASDPFSYTYVRGKIAISFDCESPTFDISLLKADMERQKELERVVADKFFDELLGYIQQAENSGNT